MGISQLLTKDYLSTFHSRCKNAPEYPFGQLEENRDKFVTWVDTRIANKFKEAGAEFKVVFIVEGIEELLNENSKEEQFEVQKKKEKR